MSTVGDLLPPGSSGPWEEAVAAGMSDELPVPYSVLMDPYQAPASMLPWLAAHHSVDLWYEDWPEARKREIIAHSSGRHPDHSGVWLSELKGTVAAAPAYLAYVDAEIIHKVSHPANQPLGRWALGIDPFNHPPHTARYLVKVDLVAPVAAFCLGRDPLGHAALVPIDLTPIERTLTAFAVSKAEHTQYSVNFAHRRRVTLDDGLDLDAGYEFGEFMDRVRL